jgi:hypothetical protein
MLSVWEDDPGPAVLVQRPIPDLARRPLAFDFDVPQPAPTIYQPGSAEFRYWTAAEALRRAADFWAPRVPGGNWQMGPTLKVILDEDEDLNAYYDRQALNFFHGPGEGGKVVYSGESPDIVCHEMGHAVLDAIKPQLWNAGSSEVAAFHESFADISAIVSALQLPSLRTAILNDTGGVLYRSSRLSRLAEQLGAAIRIQNPDAVEADCLRNAVNSFVYQDPISLPQGGPASQLSSEPHNFSRVFTGAVFEIIGALLQKKAAQPNAPTSAELLAVSGEIADILVAGVKDAPVVANWYSQAAASMVAESAATNPAYPAILKAAFVRRSILSMESASNVQALQTSAAMAMSVAKTGAAEMEPLAEIALPAHDYGLDQPLLVDAASHPRRFIAKAAATQSNGSLDPASSSTAARAFVDDLFSRGRVDYNGSGREAYLDHGRRLCSHELVAEKGAFRLRRRLFVCGFSP